MDLSKLKKGQMIVLGAGLLLFINTFIPWQRYDFFYVGVNVNAWHYFLAWFGSFLGIAAAVLIALKVIANMKINAGPLKVEHLAFVLGALGFLFVFIQLLSHLGSMFVGVWLGLLFAAALVFGTFLAMKEEGLDVKDFAALGGRGTPPPPPPQG